MKVEYLFVGPTNGKLMFINDYFSSFQIQLHNVIIKNLTQSLRWDNINLKSNFELSNFVPDRKVRQNKSFFLQVERENGQFCISSFSSFPGKDFEKVVLPCRADGQIFLFLQ